MNIHKLILLSVTLLNSASGAVFAAPTPAPARAPGTTVEANASLMGRLRVEAIGQAEVRDSLKLPARVEMDQQRVAHIGATVTGRITEIIAHPGQQVGKGESLAVLNSTELGAAQSTYLKANSSVALRRLAVQRARRLLESDVIAAAELLEREGVLAEAEVDLRAATDHLRVMGMSEESLERLSQDRTIHSFTPVSTSLAGVVIDRKVTLGQVVQPSDVLYTVADLSHVWLVAELPEQQARWARTGDEAHAEIPALPGQDIRGKLIYVADVVNRETRTVTVRMHVPNPDRLLKPQMLATLLVHKQGTQTLVLPDTAVVRDGDGEAIFIESRPGLYELRPVRLAEAEGSVRPVLDGVRVGERVVVDGAFHLNNERLRQELQ